MGWKAAEKLVRHWKIIRGDNMVSFPTPAFLFLLSSFSRNLQHADHLSLLPAGPKDTPIELALEKTYDAKAGIGMPDL
ncbi:hypothetical protein ABZP36_012473 [Zizania latifolia]